MLMNDQVICDCVIGADGVRSKARELVLGYEDKPKSSGYAIWRAWYAYLGPKTVARQNMYSLGLQVPQ